MDIKKAKDQYKWQKWYASTRKDRNGDPINWELTFESWCEIWINSGQYNNRGTRRGQYVMSRRGDIGPYSIDNVEIKLSSDNVSEQREYFKMTEEGRAKIIAARKIQASKPISEETRQKFIARNHKRWSEWREKHNK